MSEQEKKICAACGHPNDPAASSCANCGSSFGGFDEKTMVTPPGLAAIEVLEPLIQPPALGVSEVMFLVGGQKEPITIAVPPGQNFLLLGRRSERGEPPDLDLAKCGPASGTVSRRHAMIWLLNQKPTLEDLGSTNGTWVNETQLDVRQPVPLKTGDLLRLGQLFMFVYFSTGPNVVDVVELAQQGEFFGWPLTPQVLTYYIGSYLQALEDIQTIVNEILTQPVVEIVVSDINVRGTIQFSLRGASGAIRLVSEKVVPWRKQHAEPLGQLWKADQAALNSSEALRTADAVRESLSDEINLLTKSMLNRFASFLTGTEQAYFMQQMLPPVRTIALHSLELSVIRQTPP